MNIVTDITSLKTIRKNLKGKVALVPTMGHIHQGHLSLCHRAIAENDYTIATIFVNPTQFNQTADFDHYPRTLEQDIKLLENTKVDILFTPQAAELYPENYEIRVTESSLSHELEGYFRPGHFDGVLTIVLKLFNLIQPHCAYFGEKDYQQLLLIKKMVAALFLPIKIIACETLRARDGLALSSRNTRLNENQRKKASHFANLLNSNHTPNEINKLLTKQGIKIDYIEERWQRRLGAIWIDDIRLIDNIKIDNK